MDQKKAREFRMKYQSIVARCWQDRDFKKRFIENPAQILADEGIEIDEKKNYKIIEADKFSTYVVLPHEDGQEALQILYKDLNSLFRNSKQIIKAGCEIRLIQNTSDTDYLVIPFPPALYTENEKIQLSKSDGSAAVESDVVAIAEEAAIMASTVAEAAEALTSFLVVVEGFIVVV